MRTQRLMWLGVLPLTWAVLAGSWAADGDNHPLVEPTPASIINTVQEFEHHLLQGTPNHEDDTGPVTPPDPTPDAAQTAPILDMAVRSVLPQPPAHPTPSARRTKHTPPMAPPDDPQTFPD